MALIQTNIESFNYFSKKIICQNYNFTKDLDDILAQTDLNGDFMERAKSIFLFYKDGFSQMRVGKKLWLIIFIKLFVLFAVIKLFFFPNILDTKFKTDEEKSTYIMDRLTNQKSNQE